MAPVCCISRSQDQEINIKNAIFIKVLAWNHETQSFQSWYITSFIGPLLKLYILCHRGQNIGPALGGHKFTLKYIKKPQTPLLNLMKLQRNETF